MQTGCQRASLLLALNKRPTGLRSRVLLNPIWSRAGASPHSRSTQTALTSACAGCVSEDQLHALTCTQRAEPSCLLLLQTLICLMPHMCTHVQTMCQRTSPWSQHPSPAGPTWSLPALRGRSWGHIRSQAQAAPALSRSSTCAGRPGLTPTQRQVGALSLELVWCSCLQPDHTQAARVNTQQRGNTCLLAQSGTHSRCCHNIFNTGPWQDVQAEQLPCQQCSAAGGRLCSAADRCACMSLQQALSRWSC